MLISYGPAGSLFRSIDSVSGTYGFAQFGFDSIVQAVPLNGDPEDPTVLLVNCTRDEINGVFDDGNRQVRAEPHAT